MAFTFGRKNKWKCPNCGRENYKDARFCEFCGTDRDAGVKASECAAASLKEADPMMICAECGQRNPMGAAFCQGCGRSLRKKNADDEAGHSEIPDFPNRTLARVDDAAAPRRSVGASGSEGYKTILCPECGKANSFTTAFCESCGCRLSIGVEQTIQ